MRTEALNNFNALTLSTIKAAYDPNIVFRARNRIIAYVAVKSGLTVQEMQNVNAMSEESQAVFNKCLEGVDGEQIFQWYNDGGKQQFEALRDAQIEDARLAQVQHVIRLESQGPKGFYGVNAEGHAEFYQKIDHPNIIKFDVRRDGQLAVELMAYELEQRYADVGAKTKIIIAKKEILNAV